MDEQKAEEEKRESA